MTTSNIVVARSLQRVLLSAALALTASGGVFGQNAPPSDEAQVAEFGALKEIVVTATRHEESLSKVPESVSAYTQEDMDQKGMKDFSDIVRFTPGVSIDQTGTNAISIRGISSSGGAGTTGIYLDDTPIQMRSLGFNPDDTLPKTFDLDRVEVLRGPQGTLFGAGSEGGTVRYILTQPSLTKDSTYARAEVSFTQYGEPSYEAGVAHGGPIIDGTLGFRASAWFRRDGGWIDRVDPTTGAVVDSNANHQQTLVLRLAGIWKPVDAVTVTPSIFYQNKQEHDVSTYWPSSSNPSAGVFNNANPDRIPVPDRFYLPALKVDVDLGGMRLVSNTSYYVRDEITGYEGTDYNLSYYQGIGWPAAPEEVLTDPAFYPLIDTNGVHLPPGLTNYRSPATVKNQQRSFTEELRLQSDDAASRWTWTVGAFFQASRELSLERINDPMANALLEAEYGLDVADIFVDDNGVGWPLLPNGDSYYNLSISHDHQIAGFGEVTYAFTNQWKLTLGARVAKTSFDIYNFSAGPQNYGPVGPNSAYQSETPFTPKVSVAYQLDQSHLFYATYAKGFRVGGANAPLLPTCAPDLIADGYTSGKAPETYKSDSTQSYEIGAKDNFNNVLKLASSIYYIRWNHIQQNVYVAGSCGLQFTDNLGTAVAKGFDLQADVALGPVTLEAAVGYTSARFVADSAHSLAFDGDAISGQAAINASPGTNPPWNVAIGAQYNFVLGEHKSYARFDYEFESRNPWLATVQDPRSNEYTGGVGGGTTPLSYTLSSTSFVQFRTGTTFGGWDASFFIDNLLNSHTTTNYESTFIDSNNPGVPPGPQYNNYTFRPRTFGITAAYHH